MGTDNEFLDNFGNNAALEQMKRINPCFSHLIESKNLDDERTFKDGI